MSAIRQAAPSLFLYSLVILMNNDTTIQKALPLPNDSNFVFDDLYFRPGDENEEDQTDENEE